MTSQEAFLIIQQCADQHLGTKRDHQLIADAIQLLKEMVKQEETILPRSPVPLENPE